MKRGLLALAGLLLFARPIVAADIQLSVISPFQSNETVNGIEHRAPLFVMPCKGATKPLHPQEGDVYLVFKNVSSRLIELYLRDPTPVALTFYTPTGTDRGDKWTGLEYSGKTMLPANPGLVGMAYNLAPGEFRIVVLNLFKVPGIGDQERDWMAVYSTNRMKVECTLDWDEPGNTHVLRTGWFPVKVQDPEADPDGKVPEGSSADAIPSHHPGEPPVVIFHPVSH